MGFSDCCGFGVGSIASGGSGAVASVEGSDGITPATPQTGVVTLSGVDLVPRDGSRALTANWDVGGFDLFNGTFNGVALDATGPNTEFLTRAGTYVALPPSPVVSVEGSDGITPITPQTGVVTLSGVDLVPRDGSRALTANWDVGGFDLFNGTFNSVPLDATGPNTEFLTRAGTYVTLPPFGTLSNVANVGGGSGEVFRDIAPADTVNLRTFTRAPTLVTAIETVGDLVQVNVQTLPIVESRAELLALPGTSVVGPAITVTDAFELGATVTLLAGESILFSGGYIVGNGGNATAGAGIVGDVDGPLVQTLGSTEIRDCFITNNNSGLFSSALRLPSGAVDLVCNNVTLTGAIGLQIADGPIYCELNRCFINGNVNSLVESLGVNTTALQFRATNCYGVVNSGEGFFLGSQVTSEIDNCYFSAVASSPAAAINVSGGTHLITDCRVQDVGPGTLAGFLNVVGATELVVGDCFLDCNALSNPGLSGGVSNSVFSNIRCTTFLQDVVGSAVVRPAFVNVSFNNIAATATGPGAAFLADRRTFQDCVFSNVNTGRNQILSQVGANSSAVRVRFTGCVTGTGSGGGNVDIHEVPAASTVSDGVYTACNTIGTLVSIAPLGGGNINQVVTSTLGSNRCQSPIRLNNGGLPSLDYETSATCIFRGNVNASGPLRDFPYQYEIIEDNGAPLPQRPILNIVGATSIADDSVNNRTTVTLPAGGAAPFYETFGLTETTSATTRFYYASRAAGTDNQDGKRSGSTVGYYTNPNECSPFMVPIDATISSALLRFGGGSVNVGAAVYPVTYRANLYRVNGTNLTLLQALDFLIPSPTPLGVFTNGAPPLADARLSLALSLAVLAGDLIALEFQNLGGASAIAVHRTSFITLAFTP